MGGALTLELDGAIDVAGLGAPAGYTVEPVSGAVVLLSDGSSSRAGGSHFGRGGGSRPAPGFDVPSDPRLPGGGGYKGTNGLDAGAETCSGGGAVLITATSAVLDGLVRADGAPNRDVWCGPGAGGTINVAAGVISGSGTLSAAGGLRSASRIDQACGAGGIVRLAAARASFTGATDVRAGEGCSAWSVSDAEVPAEQGSAVQVDPSAGALTVLGGVYPLRGGERFERVSAERGATLRVQGAARVTAPVLVPAGATVVLASPSALEALRLAGGVDGTLQVVTPLESAWPLVVAGTLVVDERFALPRLETLRGAVITHSPESRAMHLVVAGALDLVSGARVDVAGKGFPGEATAEPNSLVRRTGSGHQNGGSHGGLGGLFDTGAVRAPTFDDPADPKAPGGGGGHTTGVPKGGPGGGIARLSVGRLLLDGDVTADGADSIGGAGAGGGAGGSVVLRAGELTGSGRVLARGSPTPSLNGGGGGGGLIRITTASSSFAGTKSVAGGLGEVPGEPGAIVETTESMAPSIVTTPAAHAVLGSPYTYAPYASGTGPLTWTLAVGPAGASVDPTSGGVQWYPLEEGTFAFELKVASTLGSATQSFSVTVTREDTSGSATGPPRITSSPSTSAHCGVPYRFSGAGAPTVAGRGPFTFSVHSTLGVPLPVDLTVDAATGDFAWTPSESEVGAHPIELRVAGPEGEARLRFAVVVECPKAAPLRVGCGCGPGDAPTSFGALAMAALAGVVPWLRRRKRRTSLSPARSA